LKVTRRIFGAGALAAGLGTSLRAAAAEGEPRHGGSLVATWGGGEPPACYVPTGGGPGPTFTASKVLERLAARAMDGSFTGELAESWKPAEDFQSYTVTLRDGVSFHDGKPMTAADVAYSVEEVWLKYAAPAMMADFSAVQVRDPRTVVLRFSKPTPEFFFASLLSGSGNYILPRHVYAGSEPPGNPANAAPIGTGPWKFKTWVRGSHVEFVKNGDYWRKGFPYLDRLVIRYVREPAGRAAAMEAGEIQIGVFNPVPPLDFKRLAALGRFIGTSQGYEEAVWATSLECNVRNPVFAKREVRQAIFQAIDRSAIVRTAYLGYARPGTGPILSPNKEYYSADASKIALDVKKAGQLLDAAGYPQKNKAPRFKVNLVAGGWFAENAKVGAAVKQALTDIGLDVTLTVPDRPTSIRRIYTDYDFDLAISNQCDPSEPVPTTTQYYTTDGIKQGVPFRNASGFSLPAMDELVGRIKVETDPEQRKALVAEFQRLAIAEAPVLPLVELETMTLASVRVQNHSNDPNWLAASWHDIWLAA
jgi:peptide/nickel transport system substrate-binding protein